MIKPNLVPLKGQLIACVIFGVLLLSLSDNLYFFVDGDVGIWQYHCIRSAMIVILILIASKLYNINLMPKNYGKVFFRSIFNTLAIFCHFGGLSFLSVAEAGAGLFTAPIFVLILSWFFFSEKFEIYRFLAVLIGTTGVVALLQPDLRNFNYLLLFPILAGFFYGLTISITKRWCSNESTLGLTACYYLSFGIVGFVMTTFFHIFLEDNNIEYSKYFFAGWRPVDFTFLCWLFAQASLNVTAIALIIYAYQKIEASLISVYEYFFLIFAAFWGWVLWSQTLGIFEWLGILLIILAGSVITKKKLNSKN
jgi:drug/metabolite transporter (DMT)-like permease